MNGPTRYPEEVSDEFPSPPWTIEDKEGRTIDIRAYDGSDEEREALQEMYENFDPADRAQGIPPSRPSKLRNWLDRILGDPCLNVFAWDDDDIVGHVTLVPPEDQDSPHELAIFVTQSHQGAGIGTELIKGVLGYGDENGAEQVWLTVERWNHAAVSLYEKIGFETTDAESFELEMAITLSAAD
jgi:RimJ/RimL family protein N-acetyltransferase